LRLRQGSDSVSGDFLAGLYGSRFLDCAIVLDVVNPAVLA
jgi:hypothetical protein